MSKEISVLQKGSLLATEALKGASQRQKMAGLRAHLALTRADIFQNEGWVFEGISHHGDGGSRLEA